MGQSKRTRAWALVRQPLHKALTRSSCKLHPILKKNQTPPYAQKTPPTWSKEREVCAQQRVREATTGLLGSALAPGSSNFESEVGPSGATPRFQKEKLAAQHNVFSEELGSWVFASPKNWRSYSWQFVMSGCHRQVTLVPVRARPPPTDPFPSTTRLPHSPPPRAPHMET